MEDKDKTKEQLISELEETRQRVTGLELVSIDAKQAKAALRKSQARFQAVFENEAVGISILTPKGNMVQNNQTLQNMLGYNNEELRHMNYIDVTDPDGIDEEKALVKELVDGKHESFHREKKYITKDGRIIWGRLTASIALDKDGKPQFGIGITEDVTEHKKADEALKESEERYKALVETTSDFIWEMDLNGAYTYCSPQIEKLWGLDPEEMLGKTPFDLLPPEDREQAIKAFSALLESSSPFTNMQMRSLDGTGRIVFLEISGVPFFDTAGRQCGYRGITRDITERKKVEDSLRESEQKHRLLFESMGSGAVYYDKKGKLLLINKNGAEDLGGKPEDFIGKHVHDIFDKNQADLILGRIKSTIKDKTVTFFEDALDLGAGSRIYATSYNPIFGLNGETIGIQIIADDITERKEAEERERQLQQELNLASRLATVGQMASGIAHEINNPLTGVIGFSGLLLKKDLPDDIRKCVNVIYEGGKRVASIIDRMLTFARQYKPERTSININEIIETTLAMRAYEMKSSNIKVTTKFAADIPLTFADAGQLQQVFLNIILNAEMEMRLAHGKGTLTVKTERINNTLRVSFKDDGLGIPKENMGRLFDPFFTTRDPNKGTGLGLSICYSIVTQHGGKIYARSRLGKGATFFVELPVVTKEEQLKMAEPAAEVPKTLSRARILVVDDDTIVQEFLTEVLGKEGYEVEIVGNGDDALEKINSEDYDVILLDVKLPGMSGIELYGCMQKMGKSLTRKVIFITGDVMNEDTIDFISKAGVPCITKPFDAEQLKKEIGRILPEV